MIYELHVFLEKNQRLLAKKQVQQLFLYMAFVLRFCHKFKIEWNEYNDLAGALPRLYQKISGYEIKEAAFAFDAYMPWGVLQQDALVYDDVNRLFYELYRTEHATSQWMLRMAEEILSCDISGNNAVTPKALRKLIAEAASQKKVKQVVDLCCGAYLLGLEVWDKMGNDADVVCYGEDTDTYMCAVGRLLLFLCDVKEFSIKEQDIMKRAEHKTFHDLPKVIVADLPLVGNRTIPVLEEDEVLGENKRTLYADWMMIYEILLQLNPGDRAFLLVTKGALVRENEYFLRKYFIDNDYIEAVISLPDGVYPNHNLPMNLLILEKNRAAEREKKVLFIDLNKQQIPSLSDHTIKQILQMFSSYQAVEGLAKVAAYEEIVNKEYLLNPQLYLVDDDILCGQLRISDVAYVTRGLQDTSRYKGAYVKERYLLNVRDIQDGEIIYETAEMIRGGNPLWEEKFLIKEDDILITAKGAALKLAIVPPDPRPAYISGNLMILRVNPDKYAPYVLYEYLLSDKGQLALGLIQTGTTIRVLGTRKMEQLAIPDFDIETAAIIGDGLKLAGLQYRQALEDVHLKYKSKKKELLSILGRGKEQ